VAAPPPSRLRAWPEDAQGVRGCRARARTAAHSWYERACPSASPHDPLIPFAPPHPFLRATQGFRLVFHFARNPYFVNSEITKEFYIQNFLRGEKVLLRTDGWVRGPAPRPCGWVGPGRACVG
jgi:hypothetical protein